MKYSILRCHHNSITTEVQEINCFENIEQARNLFRFFAFPLPSIFFITFSWGKELLPKPAWLIFSDKKNNSVYVKHRQAGTLTEDHQEREVIILIPTRSPHDDALVPTSIHANVNKRRRTIEFSLSSTALQSLKTDDDIETNSSSEEKRLPSIVRRKTQHASFLEHSCCFFFFLLGFVLFLSHHSWTASPRVCKQIHLSFPLFFLSSHWGVHTPQPHHFACVATSGPRARRTSVETS